MRIHRIKLGGFGTFNRGIDIDFGSDRLGVIIGRNEAGKSTIMSAIFGVLFGFKDSSIQQKFEPWDSHEEYAGEIEIARGGQMNSHSWQLTHLTWPSGFFTSTGAPR